jgi:hypothetical protein
LLFRGTVRAARVFELRCPKKKSFACLRAQGFCRRREDNPERTGPFQLHSFIEKVSVELSYWLVVEIVADSKRNPWRVRKAPHGSAALPMLQGLALVASRRLLDRFAGRMWVIT